jgi:hypothetical protein
MFEANPLFKATFLLFSVGFLVSCGSGGSDSAGGSGSRSACNCGSTDESSPCTGTEITVQIDRNRLDRIATFNWSFNSGGKPARCGQFANGDYWIAPSSDSSSVNLTAISAIGTGPISLDENPQLESIGLLSSSKTYGNYNPDENLESKLPKSFNYATSLVAASQLDESQYGECGTKGILGNCADAYNILTVLQAPPPLNGADTLRPSIDESEKELLSLADFNLNRLKTYDYLEGTDSTGLEVIRQRWSHSTEILGVVTSTGTGFSEGGRAFRANLLVDDYAASVAAAWHNDLMVLLSDDNTIIEKRAAIAAMLTYGKDLYYAIHDNNERVRNWGSGAGQHLGKFPPAVLFAALSNNPAYGDALRLASSAHLGFADTRGPHELEQVNTGVVTPVWGDFQDSMTILEANGYWNNMLKSQCFDGTTGTCNPNIGKKAIRDPYSYIDGPENLPGTSYMGVSFGPQRAFLASMFLIPEMCRIVNSPSFIEYVDRVNNFGIHTSNDPCAPPDPRENPDTCDAFREQGCLYYGLSNTGTATWGPDPINPGQCINNSGLQNGRFPDRHGVPLDYVYKSGQVEVHWGSIRGSASTCIVN